MPNGLSPDLVQPSHHDLIPISFTPHITPYAIGTAGESIPRTGRRALRGHCRALAASITIRAMLTESAIAQRTRGLRQPNSSDLTRESLTAAIGPATKATVPDDRSVATFAEMGARKQSPVRYWRTSAQLKRASREQSIIRSDLLPSQFCCLLASITKRAIVIESDIADRTRGLLLSISLDSIRASFTAAMNPATTARAPVDLSVEAAAESGARKQALVRYCRVSSQ